jgi:hypothetical protein
LRQFDARIKCIIESIKSFNIVIRRFFCHRLWSNIYFYIYSAFRKILYYNI